MDARARGLHGRSPRFSWPAPIGRSKTRCTGNLTSHFGKMVVLKTPGATARIMAPPTSPCLTPPRPRPRPPRHLQGLALDQPEARRVERCVSSQPVRPVAAVMHRVAVLPFVDGLLGRAEPLRQHRGRLVTGLDRRPNLRRRRCLAVKMDQHGRTPFLMSLRTDLAMKTADRRGSM